MKYADVVIDNNTDATDLRYTYAYDGDDFDHFEIGRKVTVPFGVHNKETEGYIVSVSDTKPEGASILKVQRGDDVVVFEAYIVDEFVRECVYSKQYSKLMHSVRKDNLKEIADIRLKNKPLLEYIKDYVAENDINCDNYKRR